MGRSPSGKSQLVRIREPPPKKEGEEKAESDEPEPSEIVEKKEPELHVPGYDITFSLPKSVAVLWAVGGAELRKTIERIFLESVKEVLQWLEENVKLARRGKGGENLMLGELVMGLFGHDTARNEQDPLPHIHAVILNLLRGIEDGKWSKVNSQMLMRWFRTLGPLQLNCFLEKFIDAVGVEAFRPSKDGKLEAWFELDVDPRLTSKWSSRRREIEEKTEIFGSGESSSVKARQNANLLTRMPKGNGLSRDQVETKWKLDAEAFGVTEETLKTILGRRKKIDVESRVELAIKDALKVCVSDRSYFTRQRYIQRVSEELQDVPISGLEVIKRADAALEQSNLIKPFQAKESKELIYTSVELWKLEEKLLATVEEMKDKKGPKVSNKIINQVLKKHSELSKDQEAACRKILEGGKALSCLTGVAGAGKTYCIRALKDAYTRAGYRVRGTAISGCATEGLGDATGIETRVFKYYEHNLNKTILRKVLEHGKHHIRMVYRELRGRKTWRKQSSEPLSKGDIFLGEEAGMMTTRNLDMMLGYAHRKNIPVLLLGDDRQLSPIGPGGPLPRITQLALTAHLSENFRQRKAPEDAQAAADLREGEVEKMLESYLKRGKLMVAKDRTQAAKELVKEWTNDGNAKRPEEAIILTQTREDARTLNRMCQAERKLDGSIKTKGVVVQGTSYHVGDRVLFRKQLTFKGVKNGYQGTVLGINPLKRTMTIKLDRKPNAVQAAMGRKQTIEIRYRDVEKDMLTLGYAATTHSMQGQSKKRSYCLFLGNQTSRNMAYVQLTRASESTKLFTDRHHAGRKLADLAEAIRKPEKNDLAHDQDRGLSLRIEKKGDD